MPYTARVLLQKPGFTAAAVLVLALGIGANTAMFTVINATLLKPLPYADPDRLVRLYESRVIGDNPYNVVSPPNFRDWERQARSYAQMAAYGDQDLNLAAASGAAPERVHGVICTHNLFSTLGVQPVRGRAFVAEDDRPQAQRTIIIGYGLWQRRFGGNPHIVGQPIRVDGDDYTVVGIMPPSFQFPAAATQAWVPLYRQVSPEHLQYRGNHRLNVVARLRPGVSIKQAAAELDGIAKRIRKQYPQELTGRGAAAVSLKERTVSGVRTMLLVLLGAVAMVLLIACVNVTNLFLARAVGRRREAAIRLALGASRARLVRQFAAESVAISIMGGAAGLFLASRATGVLANMAVNLPRTGAMHVDLPVLIFTAAIAITAGILSSIAPALSSSDVSLTAAIHDGSRSLSAGRGANRLRELLVAAEVALSVMLLIGAGLLLKSFARLTSVDPGYSAPRALTMRFSLPPAQYKTNAMRAAFFDQLGARVKALPGVEAVGFVTVLPLAGHFMDNTFEIVGRPPLPPGHFLDALMRAADPGYFRAMGIPVKRGRVFAPAERLENARSMVISESMARQFFPGENPLGQKLRANGETFEIVGIVGDVRKDLASEPEPAMYTSLLAGDSGFASLVVRTSMDPNALALPVEKEVSRLDPDLPVVDVLTTEELVSQGAAPRRFALTLLMLFAILAALLAAVGLYGVLAYTMGQRTREVGIRIALGARRVDVASLALLQGMRPTLAGLLVGLAGALISTRVMGALLFHVSASDPQVFVLVPLLLAAVALLSSLGPALRTASTDPASALRTE